MPQLTFDITKVNIPEGIQLADAKFNESRPVEVLLGAQVFFDILCTGTVRLGRNNPILQKTKLGWVISGPVHSDTHANDMCHLSITNEALHEQIQRFWEIEETNTHRALTSQESECEKHFINTYKRDVNGRYEVSLPVKDNHIQLGNARETAIKRFRNLEQTPALKVDYVNFMREYETLGHMTKINTSNDEAIK
ncbi:putative peptidase (DUF1758) [Popillia japonica]|uniref:Peptidase (DUF1758) n=1 Tax=Popillia japonica TaxID=7064 RepID=A0AAW1IA35_POPJA